MFAPISCSLPSQPLLPSAAPVLHTSTAVDAIMCYTSDAAATDIMLHQLHVRAATTIQMYWLMLAERRYHTYNDAGYNHYGIHKSDHDDVCWRFDKTLTSKFGLKCEIVKGHVLGRRSPLRQGNDTVEVV